MNRVAIVTGADRGLGRPIALPLGSDGINVVINYLNKYENGAPNSLAAEGMDNARTSIDPLTFLMDTANLLDQCLVGLIAMRFSPFQPAVKTAPGYEKQAAHLPNSIVVGVGGYEGEYRSGSVEKMATAFFKISRSRLTRSSSRVRARICSSGGFNRPFPGKAPSEASLDSRTQRDTILVPMPRFRSTSVAL